MGTWQGVDTGYRLTRFEVSKDHSLPSRKAMRWACRRTQGGKDAAAPSQRAQGPGPRVGVAMGVQVRRSRRSGQGLRGDRDMAGRQWARREMVKAG